MNRSAVLRCFAPFLIAVFSQAILQVGAQEWKPANGSLKTRWAKEVSPDNALPEYPRPQMVRKDWLSLNGLWNIRLGDGTETRILVPFAVESALSGVMKHFDRLTYNRSFEIPRSWQGQRVLIHFGAVDWETKVWVNGKELGVHRGGYDAFSFDITEALKAEARQEIKVEVFDPTDLGGQARGKQKLVPGSIMYTPTTGIWQTVWLEPVANAYIRSVRMIPDVDNGCLRITVDGTGTVEVAATDGGKKVASITGEGGREFIFTGSIQAAAASNSPAPALSRARRARRGREAALIEIGILNCGRAEANPRLPALPTELAAALTEVVQQAAVSHEIGVAADR